MSAVAGHHRRPLRQRLVLLMVAVVAAVLMVTVAAFMTLIFRALFADLDQRLTAALDAADRGTVTGDDGVYTDITIVVLDGSGRTRAVLQTQDRGGPATPTADAAMAATRVDHPITTGGAGGDWRLAARPQPDGSWLIAGQPVRGVQHLHDRLVLLWTTITLVVLLITVALTRHLIRYGLRPLTAIARQAARIDAGDLTRRLPDGTPDEVGQLAAALNGMLDRVQNALHERQLADERLRRFVDDAGHELRTPVTAIRGWADLYRRGAVPETEVPTAMRRIANEAERIGTLVEQLLLLASLDRPAPEAGVPDARPVADLAEIVRDAVLDARAVEPGRPITTDLPTVGVALVHGDPMALHQILANLLANIRAHTPPGTPAGIHLQRRAAAGGDQVVLRVSDDGPGVAADLGDKVFDRFVRADPGRGHRDSMGAGLGLSIVAAIVTDHGGDIRTEPGDGFTIRISLPAAAQTPRTA